MSVVEIKIKIMNMKSILKIFSLSDQVQQKKYSLQSAGKKRPF